MSRVLVGRHQRHGIDTDNRRHLVDEVEPAGRVDDLQRERVLAAADTAHLAAVTVLDDDGDGTRRAAPTAASAAAIAGRRERVRIEDRLPERRDGKLARTGEIGADDAAAPVDVVARGTGPFPKKIASPAAALPPTADADAAGPRSVTGARLRMYATSCQIWLSGTLAFASISVPGMPFLIVRNSPASSPPCLKVPVFSAGPLLLPTPPPPWQSAQKSLNSRVPAWIAAGLPASGLTTVSDCGGCCAAHGRATPRAATAANTSRLSRGISGES